MLTLNITTSIKRGVVSFTLLLLLWELLASGFIPSASQTLITFFTLIVNPIFLENVAVSSYRLIVGWSIGMFLGTLIGLVMGMFITVKQYAFPVISIFFPIPKIALLPLFLVVFGLGEESKIITIFIGSFFPSIITAYSATIRTPKTYIEAARSCGGGNWFVIRHIVLPYNLPSIIQGFRTSGSLSITLLVAAEMLGAQLGVGYWIFATGSEMKFDYMLSGVIVLSLMGLSIGLLVELLINTFCKWSKLGAEGLKGSS